MTRNRPGSQRGAPVDAGRSDSQAAVENSHARWLEAMKEEDAVFLQTLTNLTDTIKASSATREGASQAARERATGTTINTHAVKTLKMMRESIAGRDQALEQAIKFVESGATPQQVSERMAKETQMAKNYVAREKERALKIQGDIEDWGKVVAAAEKGTLQFAKGMPVSER